MVAMRKRTRTKRTEKMPEEQRHQRRSKKKVAKPTKRLSRNVAKMRKDLEDASFNTTSFKFGVGTTKIRILQKAGTERWYAPVTYGYIPTPEGGKKRVTSPKSEDSEAYCPLIEAYKALVAAGKDIEAKELKPTSRYLVHAMVRTDAGKWERKSIELPQTVWEPIARTDIDSLEPEDEDDNGFAEGGGIADAETGVIITVHRKGDAANTKYSVTLSQKAFPAKAEWLKNLGDLEEETTPSSIEVIENAVCGYLGLSDISELTGSSAPEDEYEEDDEEDVGDDDEEWEDGDDEFEEEEFEEE